MFNNSEPTAIFLIVAIALIILGWGFNRAKAYGKLGILAWLQSLVLMVPWLALFGLSAVGIYLNLASILIILILSTGIYITIGNRLRAAGQDSVFKAQAAQRLQSEEAKREAKILDVGSTEAEKVSSPEVMPIPEADLKLIQSIFGIDTFFATETISYQQGAIFKGNLRGEPEKVYPRLSAKLQEILGEQYRLFLVESPEGKPVVIVIPSSNDPGPATLAQKNLALVLLVSTIATTLETSGLLLNFDFFNNLGRYQEILPISCGIFLILIAHELGHVVMAKRHQIKLSFPYFIPNWQIATFGAITRFQSLIPNRQVLFDIAFAGPATGGLVSLLMLIIGLFLSHGESVFQIPSEFFQGSVLVGILAKVILGSAISEPLINVHPLTVVGWLGLVVSALNLLPAGQLDGGRVIQAIYGRKTARRTTIASLIILALVALFNPANPIPLYWTILILFLQRELERPSLNELTEVDDARAAWGLLALFLMLGTLIPLSPGLAGRLGIGG